MAKAGHRPSIADQIPLAEAIELLHKIPGLQTPGLTEKVLRRGLAAGRVPWDSHYHEWQRALDDPGVGDREFWNFIHVSSGSGNRQGIEIGGVSWGENWAWRRRSDGLGVYRLHGIFVARAAVIDLFPRSRWPDGIVEPPQLIEPPPPSPSPVSPPVAEPVPPAPQSKRRTAKSWTKAIEKSRGYIIELLKASPGQPTHTKRELQIECKEKFGATTRDAEQAWKELFDFVPEAAAWRKSGPRYR